jgi:rhodanese-related sulfurtransferase
MNATPTLITPADAARLGTPSDTVWLDVRSPMEFREVHLAGSRLVPLDALNGSALAGELAGKKVVIICRSGNRAKQATATLAAAGHGDLAILDGGVLAWQAAGLPVNRGQAGLSLERQVRIAAGVLVLSGVVLGTWVHPAFYGLSGFVGAGLIFAGVTDWCGMGLLLARAPWNQCGTPPAGITCQVR